jgi:DNA primase
MEISQIKSQLDIIAVAERLGIQINKYRKALCPFHADKRPSLQFSQEKQIATCFSGNCTAGSMDVIKLAEKKLQISTHEAIEWLKKEYSLQSSGASAKANAPAAATPNQIQYARLIKVFEANLKKSERAQQYLRERSLIPEALAVGYNATGWGRMKHCLVFPLKDAENRIVNFYGRSILNQSESKHYYMPERKGLYPKYPEALAEILILTESVIDAATLEQYRLSRYEHYPLRSNVLALYGTNGLSEEHQQAIKGLKYLKEIILFFDGDKAGRKALQKQAAALQQLKPDIRLMYADTPEGEDINSLLESHKPEVLEHLLKERKAVVEKEEQEETFSFSSEKPSAETPSQQAVTGSPLRSGKLITDNPELLFYSNSMLHITVLGGIKITGLDRLRVTLKIAHQEKNYLLPIRHNLDLYNNGQLEQLTQKTAEQLEITSQESITVFAQLINELENYRERKLEALKPKKEEKPTMSESEKRAALKELQSPKLMENTLQKITASGIIGEETNAFIAYLVYTSRKRENPLHLMCLGASGTGKTYLQEKVGELMPEEEKLEITTLSENAFYYFDKEELKHKLILIEDLDGAEAVLYPLRELQSKKRISKTVTLKDNKGNLKTITLKVEGPVCVSGCTTREKIYEDNANRCILVHIDSSAEQDKRIMQYQQAVSARQINKVQEAQSRQSLQNMQRLLRSVQVSNPYAQLIRLPESVFKPRRSMMLLLSFIETITFYHQYQREVKHDRESGTDYIETTVEDIAWAFKLLKEALFAKSDELSGACRSFFEDLKRYLNKGEENNPANGYKVTFYAKEIRKGLRLNPSNLKRYMLELNRYGYIKIAGGSKYKGYEYQIADYQEYESLRSEIDQRLDSIIDQIRRQAGK